MNAPLARNAFRGAPGGAVMNDGGMTPSRAESFQADMPIGASSDCAAMTRPDDIANDDVADFRARNAAQMAAGVAAFNARLAEGARRTAARRERDAAAQRAKLGTKKRLSRIHPLGLTPREAFLLKLLLERPLSVEDMEARLGVKRSGRFALLTALNRKLAAQGGLTCGYAVTDPGAVRAALGSPAAVTP